MSTKTPADDFAFLAICLKHSSDPFPKPDYEAVAKESGSASAGGAYQRLWGIKRKYGLCQAEKKGTVGNDVASPKTPKTIKGSNKRKSNGRKKVDGDGVVGEDDGDDNETPTKKKKDSPVDETQAGNNGVVGAEETKDEESAVENNVGGETVES